MLHEDDSLENDIVQALSSKWPCQKDGSEDEDSDPDDETVDEVTHVAAKDFVQILQQYFVEQGFNDAHHAALDMCAN